MQARELTPRGVGAVSIVEYSGPGALAHVLGLGGPAGLGVGDVRLARLCFAHGLADEALVVCRALDRVEVHLHGSPTLVRAACVVGSSGGREPRSLEHRARRLLENAPCEAAARILLDQCEGALRAELERLSRRDEREARALAAELAQRGRRARWALEPARVVLAGPVNAGKSTLFNVLAGAARALVADEPGTTRDVIEADVLLGAWPARVLDTAGERELAHETPSRAIEAEGQRRARLARSNADLVLWLVPLGEEAGTVPQGAVLVRTQADRAAAAPPDAIAALADPDGARRRVGEVLRAHFGLPFDPWQSGAGVPFERGQVEALEACAHGGADARDLSRTWMAER
ncbi:MAG: 50S ribosome-binding GTPase [Planctomycetota bacterium]|nr:50S ribosome-binding GTPase [Planctomycetota bacterium]